MKKKRIKFINIMSFFIMFIVVIYISLVLILFDRKYLITEKIFKSALSSFNSYLIDILYKKDNTNLNYISSRIIYLENENKLLRKESKLINNNKKYILSDVINHSNQYWFNKLDINYGYKKGIKKDNPVITSSGLVGFIDKVNKNTSKVKLLTSVNKNYVIPVIIEKDNTYISGVLNKYNYHKNSFTVTNIKSDSNISIGDKVLLSGNELYNGIYIGKIKNIKSDNYGLTKTASVLPGVDFNNLLFVSVVVK